MKKLWTTTKIFSIATLLNVVFFLCCFCFVCFGAWQVPNFDQDREYENIFGDWGQVKESLLDDIVGEIYENERLFWSNPETKQSVNSLVFAGNASAYDENHNQILTKPQYLRYIDFFGDTNDIVYTEIEIGDCIVWIDEKSDIQVGQFTTYVHRVNGQIEPTTVKPQQNSIENYASTWEQLSSLLENKTGFNKVYSHDLGFLEAINYNENSVYTYLNAPVFYDGLLWLARTNLVASTPSVGGDWFIHDENSQWLPQSYPQGTFVSFGGEYFMSTKTTDNSPPNGKSQWKKLSILSDGFIDYVLWQSGLGYNVDDVVHFEKDGKLSYFACTAEILENSLNSFIEPNSLLAELFWQEMPLYSSFTTDSIPAWVSGFNYPLKSVVEYPENSKHFFIKLETAKDNTILPSVASNWHLVPNWAEQVGVSEYNSEVNYNLADYPIGHVVRYNDNYFYKATSWVGYDPPDAKGNMWKRVLQYNDTVGPAKYLPDEYSKGDIVYLENDDGEKSYYIARKNIDAWMPFESGFRQVYKWDENYNYYNKKDDYNQYQECFVEEDDGSLTFYIDKKVATNINKHPSSNPELWEEKQFLCFEKTVITTVNGVHTVWERDSTAPTTERPSHFSAVWHESGTYCTNRYVYTNFEDDILVYKLQPTLTSTEQIPGLGADWQQIFLGDTPNYTYTEGTTGVPMFWKKTKENVTTYPSQASADWQLIGLPKLLFENKNIIDYYYVSKFNDETYFCHVNTVTYQVSTLQNAWVGKNDFMLYIWFAENVYLSGQKVVYGISKTNTWHYYIASEESTLHNCNPFSLLGHYDNHWLPLNGTESRNNW